MYMVEEESSQSGDSGTHFFKKTIDINAHQSCQLVHKHFYVFKSPTSIIVLPYN